MKVYFVRHGQSEANAQRIRQSDDSPLTELGQQQAKFVAKRLANLPADLIIASPLERARHTAEAISKKLNKEIIFSELFVEKKKPLAVMGLPIGDLEGDRIMNEVIENFYKPGWHYAEEENFEDLRKRALKAIRFLENQTAENIVVITHGFFLRNLLGVMVFGDNFNEPEAKGIYNFRTQNTGVSLCEYHPEEAHAGRTGWRIEAWNDQAHLG